MVCGSWRSSISSTTALGSRAAVPTTTRGGEDINTSVKASPCGLSSTICRASSFARLKRVLSAGLVGHRIRAVEDQDAVNVSAGVKAKPARCVYGSATASTTSTTNSVRSSNSSHCSINSRRVCRRTAASRYSIAANDISRYFRRLQRWISIGTAAAASQPSIGKLVHPKARSGRTSGEWRVESGEWRGVV